MDRFASKTPEGLPYFPAVITISWRRRPEMKTKENFDEIGTLVVENRALMPSLGSERQIIMFITGLVGEAQKEAQGQQPRLEAVLVHWYLVSGLLDVRQLLHRHW